MERAARRRESAVAVAGPIDRKFLDAIAFLLGAHYDFYIECESVGNAFAVQVPCDVAFIDFEAALCVGELGWNFHVVNDKPVKHLGADSAVQALGLFDMAASHFSRPVGYIAGIVFEQIESSQSVFVWNTQAGVRKHGVVAGGGLHSCSNGVALAAMRLVTEDFERYGWWDLGALGNLGGIVAAAIVNNDDFAFEIVAIEELSGLFDIAGDFPALFKGRYDNR